jgi:hypothetical protein
MWLGAAICAFLQCLVVNVPNNFFKTKYFPEDPQRWFEIFSLCGMYSTKSMLSGSTVTMAWHILGLRIEEMASRYGG